MNSFAVPTYGKAKLLWTNPAPLENFDKQTVALDLSKYDLVLISFMNGTSANYVNNGIFFIRDTVQVANGFLAAKRITEILLYLQTALNFRKAISMQHMEELAYLER